MPSVPLADQQFTEQHFDVVIIGAGVAGAMAGLMSARAGLRTMLIERQEFPRHKICGCCLNGRAVQILRAAGLESGLRSLQPTTTSSLSIRYRRRQLSIRMPSNVAVSRRRFDQWLVDEAVAAGCLFLDNVKASLVPTKEEQSDTGEHRHSGRAHSPVSERQIELRQSGTLQRETGRLSGSAGDWSAPHVFAKVVLACDGLGHPSLQRLAAFKANPKPGSRIGLGAVFPQSSVDDWIQPGEILMAVAPHGYAGVVQIENNQWNLAAAIDPQYLNATRSPLSSLESLFQEAGVPMLDQLAGASIKGTVPLTRTADRIAGERLFLLGDSTGYVEPFTGEGMAWALTAAVAVCPLLVQTVKEGWSPEMMTRWQSIFRSNVFREQTICRLLSAALKRPWLLPPILTTCRMFPSLTQRLVGHINRVPATLEIQ